MKITIEIPECVVNEICRVADEIRRLVADALMLKRREALAAKFISGEWGVELKCFEAGQADDQRDEKKSGKRWRR